MRLALAVVVLMALAGCRGEKPPDAADRAARRLADFWPDQPRPTTKTAPRRLAYNPYSVWGYHLQSEMSGEHGGTSLSSKYDVVLDMNPTSEAGVREVLVERLDTRTLAGQAGQQEVTTLHLDRERFFVYQTGAPPVEVMRGQPAGAGPDVAEIDRPIARMIFFPEGAVEMRPERTNWLVELGAGELVEMTLVLLPDLPAGEIAPGHRWSVRRSMRVPRGNQSLDVAYHFEYVGETRCPSGAALCAQLAFTASSTQKRVESEGKQVTVSYGFAGRTYFDLARGDIDVSRVYVEADAAEGETRLPLGGMFSLAPASRPR